MSWHESRFGSLLMTCGAWLGQAILLVARATCRLEIVAGSEHLEAARRERRPVILTFWHNRTVLATNFIYRQLCRRGFDALALTSLSRDGELAARIARGLGLAVVRGSASRGGREAMLAVYRALTRSGSSAIITPDGPRGPVYQFKAGVTILAQMSRRPILPIGLAAQRFSTLRSWDRLIVPWPFSRVAVVVGEPQTVPRGLSSEELEEERQRLQALFDDLTRQAEDELGVDDIARRSELPARDGPPPG